MEIGAKTIAAGVAVFLLGVGSTYWLMADNGKTTTSRLMAHLFATCGLRVGMTNTDGVYVDGRKIASLGMRIRRGCSYHGFSLNVDMDLAPFRGINPCGYAGLQMCQLRDLLTPEQLAGRDRAALMAAARVAALDGLQARFPELDFGLTQRRPD